jgi:hypothetical protein
MDGRSAGVVSKDISKQAPEVVFRGKTGEIDGDGLETLLQRGHGYRGKVFNRRPKRNPCPCPFGNSCHSHLWSPEL